MSLPGTPKAPTLLLLAILAWPCFAQAEAAADAVPFVMDVTPAEAIQKMRAGGKKVLTFVGYSGAGYENEPKMLAEVKEILSKEDPARTIVNIGATPDGIGAAYQLAKQLGFETTGIVSSKAKEYPGLSKFVDKVYYVQDSTWGGFLPGKQVLAPTSDAMVGASDSVVGIGGGEVGRDEILAARRAKKKVAFFDADFNHEKETLKAAKKGLPAPADFRGAAAASLDPQVSSPAEIEAYFRAKKKRVVTFIGYSGAGYEDPKAILLRAMRILKNYNPKTTVVNIGATPDGIGSVYELAKRMGFETTGIVSSQAKEYGGLSPWLDKGFYVEDATWGGYRAGTRTLNPVSEVMVSVSDDVVGFGGGEVGRDEMLAAKERGKHVLFVGADLNHDAALAKAAKKGEAAPRDFRGAASLKLTSEQDMRMAAKTADSETVLAAPGATGLLPSASYQAATPLASLVISQAQVRRRDLTLHPKHQQFVKDAPVLGYQIKSDRFEDIPAEIRAHLGKVGGTAYTREYLRENIGSVIALQMNGPEPDFYIIGKSTFADDKKYSEVPWGEVEAKNSDYLGRLKGIVPESLANRTTEMKAVLKTSPVEMVKMSDLGYSVSQEVIIRAPWGSQSKPAGMDAFLTWDAGKQGYYMVHAGPDGNPLNYVRQGKLLKKTRSALKHPLPEQIRCSDLFQAFTK